jgi:hypothetical protein
LGIHPSDDGKKMHAKNLQKTKYGKSWLDERNDQNILQPAKTIFENHLMNI